MQSLQSADLLLMLLQPGIPGCVPTEAHWRAVKHQYPAIDECVIDFVGVCKLYKERYPNGPPFFEGPALLRYCNLDFETQDYQNDLELCTQRSRYSVLGADGGVYEVDGLGLPFERLYFEARQQLQQATNSLVRERVQRQWERDELVVDDFDFVLAYEKQRDQIRCLQNMIRERKDYAPWWRRVPSDVEEFARAGRPRSI